jgi:tetratricopeptide (TPR) repeat protein
MLYLAATYGYRAEYYNFLKNRWDKAYDNGVKMREWLEKAKKFSASDMVDVQLGYGLYNYYAYVYREKIGRWRFLFSLPKGDKKKGIELLHTVREKGMYLTIEAWYFLIDIYKKERDRDNAVSLCKQLHQTYPSHPFFHILLAGIYHRNNDWQNSLRTAQEILERAQDNPYYSDYIVYQAKYLTGESSFFIGKYQEALQQFDEIIASDQSDPPYLLPWSHLRRGNIYDHIGRKNEATAEYQLVLQMENVLKVHDWAKGALKNQQRKNNE